MKQNCKAKKKSLDLKDNFSDASAMKKIIYFLLFFFLPLITSAYTLNDTDKATISIFEDKLDDMSTSKQVTLYNTINSYLLRLPSGNRVSTIFEEIASLIESELDTIADNASDSEIDDLLGDLLDDALNVVDFEVKNITSDREMISIEICNNGSDYDGYLDIKLLGNNKNKSYKHFRYQSKATDGCSKAKVFAKTFSNTAKEFSLTATIDIDDEDTANNYLKKTVQVDGSTSNNVHGSAPIKGSHDLYIRDIALYPQTDDVVMTICSDGLINGTVRTRLYSNNRTIIVEEFLINKEADTECVEHYIDGFQFLFIPGRTYVFEARVDPFNRFFEENEANNYMRTELFIPQFIAFVDGEMKPDFWVDGVAYNDDTHEIEVAICHDLGSYQGELYTRIEINTRGVMLRENVVFRTNQNICFVESIDAEKFKLTDRKRYSVRVHTDFRRQIAERDENNNIKNDVIFIGSQREDEISRDVVVDDNHGYNEHYANKVDFFIDDITFIKSERKIEVSVCTSNKDYAGYNHLLFEADNKTFTQNIYLDLNEGECQAFRIGYRLLNLDLNEDYSITVTIDPEKGVIEADEENNDYTEDINTAIN